MKRSVQIVLIFFTVALSILNNYVSIIMHRWTSMNFNSIPEFVVRSVFTIIMAFLLGLSVFKFSFNDKTVRIVTVILIMLGLATGFVLINSLGIPYITVFVSTVYVTALLFRRQSAC